MPKLKKEEKACLMLKCVLMAKDSTLIAFLDGVEVSPSTACCGEKHIRKQSYKRNFLGRVINVEIFKVETQTVA